LQPQQRASEHGVMQRLLLLASLVGCLAGCMSATYAWTPASNKPVSPKPDNCAVEVVTSQPQKAYEEIGTLKHYNGTPPKNTDGFKKAVAKQVCQAGADAVIAQANDKGELVNGTVIKYVPDFAAPVKPVTDTPPPQASDTETPIK
jgi:hypothetical protein